MSTDQLFPKPRRRMKQPTKQWFRDELAAKTEELEQLRDAIAAVARPKPPRTRRPWWHRIFRRAA